MPYAKVVAGTTGLEREVNMYWLKETPENKKTKKKLKKKTRKKKHKNLFVNNSWMPGQRILEEQVTMCGT